MKFLPAITLGCILDIAGGKQGNGVKGIKEAAKAKIDTSLFKRLAPRMMRDLMRDLSPLAEFQAAAVVGNGGGESGGFMLIQELKPTVPGSKGGSASFNGRHGHHRKPGRRRVFEMGRKPDSYDANYEMLRRELKGPEKGTMPKLRATKTIDEATKSFMVTFERPGIPHFEGRVKWSKMALAAYEAEEKKIAKEPPVVALAMREAPARRRKRAAPPRRRKNSTRQK